MLIEAIWVCLRKNGREIVVEDGKVPRRLSQEGKVALPIITDGVHVVARAIEQPAVGAAIIVLDPPIRIGVPGVIETAPLIVRRLRMRLMLNTHTIDITQAGLLSVPAWQPAEEMIKRTVLHHHHDDVLESG